MVPFSPGPQVAERDTLIGPWRVLDQVGSGGNGMVFRAVHAYRPEAGLYAFKLAMEPEDDRFEREAQLLARIRHPSVPRYEGSGFWISPVGQVHPYVVMQWAEGLPLYDWGARYGLTLRQAMRLLAQLARALEATHVYGVHRDVKGDNVLVSPQGHVMLVDYGCCWYSDARPITDTPIPPGTHPYRSPQLLRFKYRYRRDPHAYYEFQPSDDVYALGVTAYRLLTGRYPPPRTDPECADDPRRLRPPELSAPPELEARCPELSALVMRMLSEDPAARGSAGELAEAFERLVKKAGRAADLPWVERSSRLPIEKETQQGPVGGLELKELLPRLAVPVALVALALLLGKSVDPGDEVDEPRAPGASGKPDAGTVGMGNTALASVAPASEIPEDEQEVSRDMPDRPFDGQKRPPCSSDEQPINGGCWIPVGGKKPPCKEGWFEYEGRCYAPFILLKSPPPTSDEP
jgi:serine/threonine protein kinase